MAGVSAIWRTGRSASGRQSGGVRWYFRSVRFGITAADEADVIENPDDIALRATALRELLWVAGFRVTPLRAGTVDIDKTDVSLRASLWAGV